MITIFGKAVPLYGLYCTLGVALAVGVGFLLIKKREIAPFDFACAGIFILIGALLGAKLLFLLVSVKQIIQLRLTFMQVMQGGFVFYGGLLGGAAGLLLYTKIYKQSFKDYSDVCAVVLPLGHAFGRVGCFRGGCCYGIAYSGIGSYTYTESLNASTPLGVPLLPVQLIEAVCLLVLFVVLLLLFLKRKRGFNVYLAYSIAYAVLRFTLEFFRGDRERGLFFLSTSQWISLALLVGAVVVWWVENRPKTKEHTVE